MLVNKYGLHKDKDGVWWLLQNVTTNAINLPGECPVETVGGRGMGQCYHDIDLAAQSRLTCAFEDDVLANPVVDFFLPIPRARRRVAHLRIPETQLANALHVLMKIQGLFSPIVPMAAPIWSNPVTWIRRVGNSNLQTLIIYGDQRKGIDFEARCEQVMDMALTQEVNVLFVSYSDPSYFRKKEVLELSVSDFNDPVLMLFAAFPEELVRTMGAELIRKFMRGEFEYVTTSTA